MDFRSLTVKELFDDPRTAAVVKEMAPQLLKYPVKMFNKKSCGEIFDRVVKVGIGAAARSSTASSRSASCRWTRPKRSRPRSTSSSSKRKNRASAGLAPCRSVLKRDFVFYAGNAFRTI